MEAGGGLRFPVPPIPAIQPIRAELERLERITVCTRPFRAQGPRIEAERLGDKLVVHNYGHGGAGWSLSWGSAAMAASLALTDGAREFAVIGCGALGLTSALLLLRAGAKVTIYARDLPSDTRSARATGLWSPDSRIALAAATDYAVAARWETLARRSWAEYQTLLQLPGRPIDFHDRYVLSDVPPQKALEARYEAEPVGFAHLEQRLSDLYPAPIDLGPTPTDFGPEPGSHPFPTAFCRYTRTLRFNIAAYTRQLLREFHERGGVLRRAEFHAPTQLCELAEPVLVHCTGWAARALFGDESLTPVRGQIGWLPTQPEVNYSLQSGKNNVVGRGDGIALQFGASSDETGWNDPNEVPDRAEAESVLRWLADLQRQMP